MNEIIPKKIEKYLTDRKSTRLNSSHDQISYAVFCLKKKKKKREDAEQGKHQTGALGAHKDYTLDHATRQLEIRDPDRRGLQTYTTIHTRPLMPPEV